MCVNVFLFFPVHAHEELQGRHVFEGLPLRADISRESSAGVFLREGTCLEQSCHISMSDG